MDNLGVVANAEPGWLAKLVDVALVGVAPIDGSRLPVDQTIARLRSTALSQLDEQTLRAFTERLPKIDLHRHLNGSIPIERLLAIAGRVNAAIPAKDVDALRPRMYGGDKTLAAYLRKFDIIGKVFKSPEVIEELAAACVSDAARDNLVHVEVRFSPQYMTSMHPLDAEDVIKAVAQGVQRGMREGQITARLIVVISRNAPVDEGTRMTQLAAKYRELGVVGVDLAGPEADFPPGPFASAFAEAKRAGLCVTAHAGEDAGAASVNAAVLELGADRVGHAVRAAEDNAVVELLRTRGIFTEACPTANVQVGAVAEYAHHPVVAFLRHGMKQTVNTDNPALSGVTLSQELQRVISTFELTLGEIEQVLQNAIDGAFLTEAERATLTQVVVPRLAQAERDLLQDLANAA